GRYAHVKLGRADDKPEFSNTSWVSMMFSAGIAVGLVNWAFVEPIYYLATPPFDIEPHSSAAAEWGHMYALFHWSFVPWSLYAVAAVPIAYVLYVKRTPFMRMSEACRPVLKEQTNGIGGSIVNTLVILGMVGGASTSLGLGVPLVSAFTANLFGIDDSLLLRLGVLLLWTMIFSVSVYKGLNAGIRILSDINILLAIIIIAFILIVGPTVFTLSLTANSLGLMLDNFLRMSFWLDPIDHGGFPNAWTLFYWAWWVAYAPTMGMFFGRISKGRTIRELVLGMILWGSLGCVSFIAICGGYAIDLEMSGALNITQLLADEGIPHTVVSIVNTLPFSGIFSFLFTVLCFVFLVTTLDSAAYVLASVSTKNLKGTEEPAKYTRLVWAFVLALVAVGLIYVDGLVTVQSATIVTALPLLPIMFLIAYSLVKALKQDFGDQVKPQVMIIENK
ncbi:MAG: BCCT family transporter, partial [Emcibacteraceae bacterium]|nr:BCCT family transporter [Emcibacteraceae bacterium]